MPAPASGRRPTRSSCSAPPGRALVAAALVAAAAVAVPLPSIAAPDGGSVVVSEVYGAGGNTGATYDQDYVELFNPTTAPVDLGGYSVQYRSATGTGNPSGVVPLTGSIPAGGHFLLGLATGSSGVPLPERPDQQAGGVNLSGTTGTVFLARQAAVLVSPPTGSATGRADLADLVGFGTSNTFETRMAPAPSTTASISRAATGADTDVNATDLAAGSPSPTNAGGDDPGPGGDVTIAEIQGTGDTSPKAGQTVTTEGVVTASYPTGGFRGFYLQTAGTGGAFDQAAHDASDAVFVYLGAATAESYPALGDHLRVTGEVSEFAGLTEVSAAPAGLERLAEPATVTPAPYDVPPADSEREDLEGMLLAPPGEYTVSDVYDLNSFAEIALARGPVPLRQPTDVARPGSAEAAAVAADNAARAVSLDDGSSTNYLGAGKDTPLPWLTGHPSIRVGAHTQLSRPVVLDYRNSTWKYQPTTQLTVANDAEVRPAEFPDTRAGAPETVAGETTIASFNVLNFFRETGADYEADGGDCSSYNDRAGNPVTVNTCTGEGPRGAWDATNRDRQQAKTVRAINRLDAEVLSLEEIENSAKFAGPDRRDDALAFLVGALNADAGRAKWDYVRSPDPGDRPALADEDVIRTAFVYQPDEVEPAGESRILTGSAAFGNAREPLAQVFRPVGGYAEQEFLAVVNHLKSKGSGEGDDADQGDGQGASNASRVAQARALVSFVGSVQADTGVERVFLTGDFNSYTQEDPMRVLYEAGYTDVTSEHGDESTYVFDGLVGSLDHVLVNGAMRADLRGADVWNINSGESVAYEYSRHNYNATLFYAPDPFRSSDHDPLKVGFDNPQDPQPSTVTASIRPHQPGVGSPAVVTALVRTDRGPVPGGRVEVRDGDVVLGSAVVADGTARVPVTFGPAYKNRTVTLTVAFTGSDLAEPASTTLAVRVRNKPKG